MLLTIVQVVIFYLKKTQEPTPQGGAENLKGAALYGRVAGWVKVRIAVTLSPASRGDPGSMPPLLTLGRWTGQERLSKKEFGVIYH
jgi:hypothetical protein